MDTYTSSCLTESPREKPQVLAAVQAPEVEHAPGAVQAPAAGQGSSSVPPKLSTDQDATSPQAHQEVGIKSTAGAEAVAPAVHVASVTPSYDALVQLVLKEVQGKLAVKELTAEGKGHPPAQQHVNDHGVGSAGRPAPAHTSTQPAPVAYPASKLPTLVALQEELHAVEEEEKRLEAEIAGFQGLHEELQSLQRQQSEDWGSCSEILDTAQAAHEVAARKLKAVQLLAGNNSSNPTNTSATNTSSSTSNAEQAAWRQDLGVKELAVQLAVAAVRDAEQACEAAETKYNITGDRLKRCRDEQQEAEARLTAMKAKKRRLMVETRSNPIARWAGRLGLW